MSSINSDGYRAGCEIGEGLSEFSPEVIFLFAAITYRDQFPDLFDGLYDELGSRDVIVIGGTSDGVYETERVVHHGVSALALNTEGKVTWITAVEPGVAADSFGAAKRCAERISSGLDGQVDFAFACADGLKADGNQIVRGLSGILTVPFLGGLTGDDRKFARSFVFVNGEAHEDSVAILAARGPLSFVVSSASGWSPIGETGTVEKCSGATVERISGMTPRRFLREQLGKSPGETDLGVVPLARMHPNGAGHYALLTPSHFDEETGAATMFGSMEQGVSVRVCTATLDDVLNGVDEAMTGLTKKPIVPVGALVVSCAGRRWLLEDRCKEEVERVMAAAGKKIPLAGLPSLGEIGPFLKEDGTYTPVFFHNVTFVVCLFGES